MPAKLAKADITPVRQRTQFSCMAASMSMALKCHGQGHCDEDTVNKVMGAQPMQGATWEQALACAQHYGMRGTLTSPCTFKQLKAWTDAGVPVLIAWNPEGREWSHASVVFDVDDDENVHVADPNIPDPEQTVRVVPKAEFYNKWYEKWPKYLVRRPAMAIEREITQDGRQVMAADFMAGKKEQRSQKDKGMARFLKHGPVRPTEKSDAAKAMGKAQWDARKEEGRAGLPGAGLGAGYHKDKSRYDRGEGKRIEREAGSLTQPLMTRRDYGAVTASDYASILKYAVDLPPEVEEDVKEIQKKNPDYTEGQAWATAWSIHCKHRDPGSEHCQMSPSEYFKAAKFPAGVTMTVDEVADVVGPEFKEMNEDPPASVVKVREEMQKKAGSPLLATETFAEMLKTTKFEKGKSMTVDEVAAVVGPEFKEMNEDPPASVVKLREEMSKTAAINWTTVATSLLKASKGLTEDDLHYRAYLRAIISDDSATAKHLVSKFKGAEKARDELIDEAGKGKTAAVTAGGKWGFTKGTESACTAGVNKLQKAAKRIANALYAKDEGSVGFLQKHAAKAGSKTASMLLKAMEDIGPAAMLRAGKTAGKSGNGLYGFSEKTAKLGLDACSALHHEAGMIAADLFARKGADPVKVAGYLTANAKKGKCAFSDLLAEVAPDVNAMVIDKLAASKKKASLVERLAAKIAADFMASDETADDELVDDTLVEP
jgi:predicted double-glycine peptidase